MQAHQDMIRAMLAENRFLPVVAVPDAADALPLARALLAGGISNIEVTLRTPSALDVIRTLATVDGLTVGAGTVLEPAQARAAKEAGARYIVSPGYDGTVGAACSDLDIPYLPGAATPTEVQALRARGYRFLKFFPAEAMGGVKTLSAFAPVFPDVAFCATGGITPQAVPAYLALPNIAAVGLSSVASAAQIADKNWAGIEESARSIINLLK